MAKKKEDQVVVDTSKIIQHEIYDEMKTSFLIRLMSHTAHFLR